MSGHSQPTGSTQMELPELTSSAEGSPAKTSATATPLGEIVRDWMANAAACGLNTTASLANYDPASSSWKMSRLWLDVDSTAFLGALPPEGMMLSGVVYPQPSWVPPITATASGLLPTPAKREGRDWSKASILAALDRGGCVARRICSRSAMLRSSPEIVGLNPSFAEWMMGFPIGWAALEPAEMPSSRKSPK
jgi:hypothetical protein